MMPSIPQMLIVLAIVVVLFGAGRLRTLGADFGAMFGNFKKGIQGDPELEEKTDEVLSQIGDQVKDAVRSGVSEIKREVTKR